MAQEGPRWPEIAPRWGGDLTGRRAVSGERVQIIGTFLGILGVEMQPKTKQDGPKIAQDGPGKAQRWPEHGP